VGYVFHVGERGGGEKTFLNVFLKTMEETGLYSWAVFKTRLKDKVFVD
jgi:hypothetical protein